MNEILYQVWLTMQSNISNVKIRALKRRFKSFANIYHADTGELSKAEGMGNAVLDKNLDGARCVLEKCEKDGIDILSYYCDSYPKRLKQISSPPVLLYVKGRLPLIDEMLTIAVVGARRASLYGKASAGEISKQLARSGAIVISGMARGIDTAAHRGALKAEGETIAVLGCGVDVCYPPENEELKRVIEGHGAVISEYPPGTAPFAANFPVRNRIISGLSVATVMVEGGATSGSAITARLSIEQGRETFCVPGRIDSELSVGPHQLIRDGARLVASAKDIITDLSCDYPELMVDVMLGETARERIVNKRMEKLPFEQKQIMGLLKADFPTHIDDICHEASLEPSVANQSLLMLEINGLITSLPGKQYILRK